MTIRVAGAATVVLAGILAAVGLLPGGAGAAEASVKVQVVMVEASDKGAKVDPRLAHFAEDMKKRKFAYTSFEHAGEQTVSLRVGKVEKFLLPNGHVAKLEFRQVDSDGKWRLNIDVPGHGYATYSVKAGEEFIFQAGRHGSADVFLQLKHSQG